MTAQRQFLTLLADHGGIVHRVSRLYAEDAADREDLAQEIAYQLWRSFGTFRGASKPGTWVYRVALNTALGRTRKRRPLLSYFARLPERGEPPTAEDSELDRLYAAIRRLPRADRALVALYLEDYSHAEIGRMLGLTENNVGVKLHRIKRKLKQLLNLPEHEPRLP